MAALSRALRSSGLGVPMIGVPEVAEAGDLDECLARIATCLGDPGAA